MCETELEEMVNDGINRHREQIGLRVVQNNPSYAIDEISVRRIVGDGKFPIYYMINLKLELF